jgi:hypothetical protein
MMFSGIAGVLGGRFVADDFVFMGVSFACTSSGFVRALAVLGFAFAVVVFFEAVFAFGFAVGFFVIFAIFFSLLKGFVSVCYTNVIYIFSQFLFSW